jgi:Asp-tRNA(Asn)/Glu-tRNA(Gln) amidotransferase A subunit family amidase
MLQSHVWPKAGPGLHAAWDRTSQLLQARGYQPQNVLLPDEFAKMSEWHSILTSHESRSSFLGHYLARKDQLDKVIVNIFERGASLTADVIKETYDGVAKLRVQWDEFASQYDLIITPSTTDSAPEGLTWTGDACFNAMWTALHCPAVNVPGLKGSGALPIGLTVVGGRWCDEQVLRGAAMLGEILKMLS